jgi:hypothetical protein
LTIALDALGAAYMRLAAEHGIDPALLHWIAVMRAGTFESLAAQRRRHQLAGGLRLDPQPKLF